MSRLSWGPRVSGVLVGALLVSKLGNQLLFLAVPLAVYDSTGSALLSLLSFAVQTLPFVASPFLGVLVDRFDRRRVFALSEAVQAVAIGILAFSLSGRPGAEMLVLLAIAGTGSVMSGILINFVLVPALVPRDKLGRVNGLYTAVGQAVALAGLPLGGLAYAFLGAELTLWLDCATFLMTIGVAFFIPRDMLPKGAPSQPLAALKEGWKFLREDTRMFRLAAILGLCNLGAGSLTVVVLQSATIQWGWSAGPAGLAMGVGAAGTAIGALLGSARITESNVGRRLSSGLFVILMGAALQLGFAYSSILLVGYLILSVGEGMVNVQSVFMRQTGIPPEFAGRVNTTLRMIIMGTIPLSSVIQAPLQSSSMFIRMAVPVVCTIGALGIWMRESRRSGRVIDDKRLESGKVSHGA